MALKNTYVEKAINTVKGDKTLEDAVDYVTVDSPIMANMPMSPTNKGFNDVYEVVKEVDGIPQTDLDAPIPEIDLSTDLEQISLNSFSGRIIAGIDKLKQLDTNIASYVGERLPKHYRRTMEQMEKTWIYNFARAFALANYTADNSRVIDGGGSSNTNSTIIAVRWEPGEVEGLYDPNGFGDGKLFEEIFESNGAAYNLDGRTVYSMVAKNYIGFKFANPRYVTAMVNIDIASIPTKKQLGALIDNAGGADALYMHPTLAREISDTYGTDKINYEAGDTNIAQMFRLYDDVPMIGSRHFDYGTEANVTL